LQSVTTQDKYVCYTLSVTFFQYLKTTDFPKPKLCLVTQQFYICLGMLNNVTLEFRGAIVGMQSLKVQGSVPSSVSFVLYSNNTSSRCSLLSNVL
jgi:hypothetical protein